MKRNVLVLALCLLAATLWGCASTQQTKGDQSLGQKTLVVQMPGNLPYGMYNDPVLVGDDLFLCVGDTVSSVDKVVEYNLRTKEVKTLFTSKFKEAQVQGTLANSRWVVWEDANANTDGETFYLLDRNTGKPTRLDDYLGSTGDMDMSGPVLSGNFMAWFKEPQGQEVTVQLTNLKTKTTREVATLVHPGFYNALLSLKEETLLWTDHSDGKGYYHIYQIDTQKIKTIEAPYPYPGSPKLSGGLLFSINFDDDRNWADQDFGWFDPTDSTYRSCKPEGVEYVNRFGVSGDILAVMDDKNKLHFVDVKKDRELEVNNPLNTIDSIDVFPDGRVVAGSSDSKNGKSTLVIFNFGEK